MFLEGVELRFFFIFVDVDGGREDIYYGYRFRYGYVGGGVGYYFEGYRLFFWGYC